MTTTTAVPSSDVSDFLYNVQKLDEAVTSSALTYVDRFGVERLTAAGTMARFAALNPRGAWATATVYQPRDLVLESGTWYISLDTHTSGATFAGDLTAHWRPEQGVTLADLANTASGVLGFHLVAYTKTDGETAAGAVIHNKEYRPGNFWRYLPIAEAAAIVAGTSTYDCSALFTVWFAANNECHLPPGTYVSAVESTLRSNLTVTFAAGAKIKHAAGVTTEFILRGNALTNIKFKNLTIEGNGLAGVSSVYLTSCSDVDFELPNISKSGAVAILHDGCTNLSVRGGSLSRNYFYGVEERAGVGCKYIGTRYHLNGNTGVASNAGGRGLVIWKSSGAKVALNDFVANTEYGFRLYSEVADAALENVDSNISNNYFEDNVSADIVVYNESGNVRRHIISSNLVKRTVNTTIGGSVIIQGSKIRVTDTHVTKLGTFGTEAAFILFEADDCSLRGCSAENTAEAVGFGTSTNCVVEGFVGKGVGRVGIPLGFGIRVKNSEFTHGGAGTTDVAIQNYDATGRNYYEGNLFDGFHTGLYIADEAVAIYRNETRNSSFAGLRVSGNDISNLECGANRWDATEPSVLLTLQKLPNTAARVYGTGVPSALTWARGDEHIYTNTAVGSPPFARCTVAGTPGTWVDAADL